MNNKQKKSDNYKMVRKSGNKCLLLLTDNKENLLASLEGCQNIVTQMVVAEDKGKLDNDEKKYLLEFIKDNNYAITKEVARDLDMSIIKHLDGENEYLTEEKLIKKVAEGIDFAKVYVGRLSRYVFKIPEDAKEVHYDFADAKVTKLVVGRNCSASVDFRDNKHIKNVILEENFAGTINLSRTAVENLYIGPHGRCNLIAEDVKNCFNLYVADGCSGSFNISNSCLSELSIGNGCDGQIIIENHGTNTEIQKLVLGENSAESINVLGQKDTETVYVKAANNMPFYKKLYYNAYKMIHNRFM